jgi:predicted nucleic acid-binding protein
VIVLDPSAAVLGLLNDGAARRALATDDVAVPHLADSEIVHALRRQIRRGRIEPDDADRALDRWTRIGVRRFAVVGVLDRMWDLRHNLSAYDATYVALAEVLGCSLVTGDRRLAGAPGPTCSIVVVRS